MQHLSTTNTDFNCTKCKQPDSLSSSVVDDTGDDVDEMEGTDLLDMISSSLDRFNAIVHLSDDATSNLTSGLGDSVNSLIGTINQNGKELMTNNNNNTSSLNDQFIFPTNNQFEPSLEQLIHMVFNIMFYS